MRMEYLLVALLSAPVYAAPGGAETPRPKTLERGLSHFTFSGWEGPELPVFVYVPWKGSPAHAPIVIMMHGASRGAARYLADWDGVAEKHGLIVVAPLFARTDFPDSWSYNSGGVFDGSVSTRRDESQWAFSAIEPLFDYVVTAVRGQQSGYTLYGHSAGSQFAHRYLYFKPEARVRRFLLANAGWYTAPDQAVAFPYGLRDSGVSQSQLVQVLSKDVVILLGDRDDDPAHPSLRRTPEAMAQGPHRYARGLHFFRTARSVAATLKTPFGWRLQPVAGVGHDNAGMALAAGPLVR